MSETKTTEKFTGDSYEIVAWARNQEVLLFERFGDYTGEWLLLSADKENYFLYKDYYGSCSGCDSYEAELGWDEGWTHEKAQKFAVNYIPFLEIPHTTAANLVRENTLMRILPANIRDDQTEADLPTFCNDATVIIKLGEGIEITTNDILTVNNQEVKQRALKIFGYEKFVAETQMEEIDQNGENKLLKHGDIVFAYVKDASSDRRYLLRVPPGMTSIREAIAWTFGFTADEYRPLVET